MDFHRYVARVLALIDLEILSIENALHTGVYADHVSTRQAIGKRQGLILARASVTNSLAPEEKRDMRIN